MNHSAVPVARTGNQWSIVVFGFLCLAFSYSVRSAFSLVIPMLETDYGWTRTSVSSIFSVALVVMAIVSPIAGRMVDKYEPKFVLFIGTGAMGVGCFLASVTDQWWLVMIGFGGISAVGFGLVAPHVLSTAIEQRFNSHQGIAISVSTSGSTAGQFVLVPIVALMVTVVSWQSSFVVIGLACILMAFAIHRYFPSALTSGKRVEGSGDDNTDWMEDIALLARFPAFHILLWSYVICGYTTSGIIETHFLPFASFCGVPPVASATAFGILSVANMIGMIFVGWLTGHVNGAFLLAGIYAIRVTSFLLLMDVRVEYETLVMFSVVFGLVDYSTFPVTARLVAIHVKRRVVGLAMGLILGAHQLGGAVGAYAGGYMYEKYLQYDWVWMSSIWVTIVACLLVLPLAKGVRNGNGGLDVVK